MIWYDVIWWDGEVLRLFRRYTHTPCLWQGGVLAHEVKMKMKRGMKMRWKWKWDERLLIRDPRRGTQKKREGANTHTNTPGPEPANPERAREKKNGGRRTRNKTSGGGGRRKRLNQPDTAKTYAYLGTRRTWKNAWNRGPNGELVGEQKEKQRLKGTQFKPRKSRVNPSRERCQVMPCGLKQPCKFEWIRCTHVEPHQKPKWPHL